MEGDAGASRLNPINEDDSLGPEVTVEDSKDSEAGADPTGSAVTVEDSKESEAGADPTGSAVTVEDSKESEAGADPDSSAVTESDENASDDGAAEEAAAEDAAAEEAAAEDAASGRGPSRVGRGWFAAIAAILLIVAGGVGASGYYALRSHQDIQALQRNNALALSIAKDCVAATQAPDTSSMAASEQKIIDCGTDQYRTQALLYSSMLVQAYQAADVHLKVSALRAAVEHNNPDGSVDMLVAIRISLSNAEQQNQETGYRLRVRMSPTDGTYKISKLDQVTK
ncbi:Mce protein [Mycobacterium asiaticum]|uniref:Mce protein n=1 Tax=Mycobacterium asiaticum TaxID=1790 RepID=A0A1A3NYI7_MYCAS|nr:Mce protein [Mycobacterium asiaticum]OBK25402.1 Mce protein [Mycobacterium asiaticum]